MCYSTYYNTSIGRFWRCSDATLTKCEQLFLHYHPGDACKSIRFKKERLIKSVHRLEGDKILEEHPTERAQLRLHPESSDALTAGLSNHLYDMPPKWEMGACIIAARRYIYSDGVISPHPQAQFHLDSRAVWQATPSAPHLRPSRPILRPLRP